MFTAMGFIVMWVAASSTCTANDVESPPRPWGPTPSWFTAAVSCSSSLAPSRSAQRLLARRAGAATHDRRLQVHAIDLHASPDRHVVDRHPRVLAGEVVGVLGHADVGHDGCQHRARTLVALCRGQPREALLHIVG